MIDRLIGLIKAAYVAMDRVDIRGYNDRKTIILAQDGLREVCAALESMKKKEENDAEHCDGGGESVSADT